MSKLNRVGDILVDGDWGGGGVDGDGGTLPELPARPSPTPPRDKISRKGNTSLRYSTPLAGIGVRGLDPRP